MKFNVNSPVFSFLDTFARFVCLNVVFLITCLPVVTIGTAVCALYQTMFKYIENEDIKLVNTYIGRLKSNLADGTKAFLLLFLAAAIISYNLFFWYNLKSTLGMMVFGIMILAAIALVISSVFLFPLVAHFKNTLFRTVENSFFISVRNLRMTVILLLIDAGAFSLAYFSGFFRVMYIIFGLAFIIYCKSLIISKVFQKYAARN